MAFEPEMAEEKVTDSGPSAMSWGPAPSTGYAFIHGVPSTTDAYLPARAVGGMPVTFYRHTPMGAKDVDVAVPKTLPRISDFVDLSVSSGDDHNAAVDDDDDNESGDIKDDDGGDAVMARSDDDGPAGNGGQPAQLVDVDVSDEDTEEEEEHPDRRWCRSMLREWHAQDLAVTQGGGSDSDWEPEEPVRGGIAARVARKNASLRAFDGDASDPVNVSE